MTNIKHLNDAGATTELMYLESTWMVNTGWEGQWKTGVEVVSEKKNTERMNKTFYLIAQQGGYRLKCTF